MATQPTYYTVANAPFFPGLVALLNSLRLTGNHGEVAVLDVGLTDPQRRTLASHVRLIDPPAAVEANPFLTKPYPHRLPEDGVAMILDSDIIVTRDLGGIAQRAAAGKICLYPDHPIAAERWFADWQDGFALKRPLRRGRYLGAGFLALSLGRWRLFLKRWSELCERIPQGAHFSREPDQPYWAGDQDALNALLLSEVPADAIEPLPEQEVVLWDSLREVEVVDEATLSCRRRDAVPAMLHYSYRPKPWQARAWLRVTDDAFVKLLPRVLFAEDVELRLDPASLPIWARPGAAGRAAVRALDAGHLTVKAAINAPPEPLSRRLLALRHELFYRLGR